MKLIKMLGLAAIAALAAMAILGAGTASATRLCKTNTLPCGSSYGSGTALTAELTGGNEATLTSGFAVIKCKTSRVEGRTTSAGGGAGVAVSGEVTSAEWTNCSCNLGGAVTTGTEGTPWSASLEWKKEMSGELSVSGATGWFTCAGEKCTYTGTAKSTATGGAPATIAAEASLNRVSGKSGIFCSATATWKGTYTLTTPAEAWPTES